MDENAKKLGLIFSFALIIIIIIIVLVFIMNSAGVNPPDELMPTTTTTRAIDYGFRNLTGAEQNEFNAFFNDERIALALANATVMNPGLLNINLLGSEVSKFYFVFTYFSLLNNAPSSMDIEQINIYTQRFFGEALNPENLNNYKDEEGYIFDFNENINYCFQPVKIDDNTLLVHRTLNRSSDCKTNTNHEDIIATVAINFDRNHGSIVIRGYRILKLH